MAKQWITHKAVVGVDQAVPAPPAPPAPPVPEAMPTVLPPPPPPPPPDGQEENDIVSQPKNTDENSMDIASDEEGGTQGGR